MATTTPTAAWGVQSTSETGIITEMSIDKEAISAPEINEIGQVINQVMYDKKQTVSVTMLVSASTEVPGEGTLVTINDKVKGAVANGTILESNHDFRKIQLTLVSFAKCEKKMEDKTGTTAAPSVSA